MFNLPVPTADGEVFGLAGRDGPNRNPLLLGGRQRLKLSLTGVATFVPALGRPWKFFGAPKVSETPGLWMCWLSQAWDGRFDSEPEGYGDL